MEKDNFFFLRCCYCNCWCCGRRDLRAHKCWGASVPLIRFPLRYGRVPSGAAFGRQAPSYLQLSVHGPWVLGLGVACAVCNLLKMQCWPASGPTRSDRMDPSMLPVRWVAWCSRVASTCCQIERWQIRPHQRLRSWQHASLCRECCSHSLQRVHGRVRKGRKSRFLCAGAGFFGADDVHSHIKSATSAVRAHVCMQFFLFVLSVLDPLTAS